MNKHNKLRIAIDGGASTGKSTVAKALAEKLGINYVNTGSMYRLITLFAHRNNLLDHWDELVKELKKINIDYINGKLVSTFEYLPEDLTSPSVSHLVSSVASSAKVRQFASDIQKRVGQQEGVLMEGRDITTVVMPDADFKFFLVVSDEEAAKRRHAEYQAHGTNITFEEVLQNVRQRNQIDSTREAAPLTQTEDSVLIDTSNKTPKEIVREMLGVIDG